MPTSLQQLIQTSLQLPQSSVTWKTIVLDFHIYNLCFFYLFHPSQDTGSRCVADSAGFILSILSARISGGGTIHSPGFPFHPCLRKGGLDDKEPKVRSPPTRVSVCLSLCQVLWQQARRVGQELPYDSILCTQHIWSLSREQLLPAEHAVSL